MMMEDFFFHLPENKASAKMARKLKEVCPWHD
jgi:hypothetical protein